MSLRDQDFPHSVLSVNGTHLVVTETSLARSLFVVHGWMRQNLPFGTSSVAVDIALLALSRREERRPAYVKDFHLVLGYSEDRVSELLRELADTGWLSLQRDDGDGRLRQVLPTARLIAAFADCQRLFDDTLRTLATTK